jgi:hypothetical protein
MSCTTLTSTYGVWLITAVLQSVYVPSPWCLFRFIEDDIVSTALQCSKHGSIFSGIQRMLWPGSAWLVRFVSSRAPTVHTVYNRFSCYGDCAFSEKAHNIYFCLSSLLETLQLSIFVYATYWLVFSLIIFPSRFPLTAHRSPYQVPDRKLWRF